MNGDRFILGTVPTAFVIGAGEVGGRLAGALQRSGSEVRTVTRTNGWEAALDEADASPRIVAVREEQLAAVLARFPETLRERLVLVQNGFLEAVHGDLGPVTRGLVWFTSKGDFFQVLCPSEFHGPHAASLARAIDAGGISSVTLADRSAYLRAMVIKGVWNAVVGLPLAVHGVDLATYREEHRDEMEAAVSEGVRAAGAAYAVDVGADAALEKLRATTPDLGWVRGGKKALPWRNGAIAWFGRRHGVPTPVNDRLLREAGYDPGSDPRSTPTGR
jgi:ketopantoate reductase